MAHCGSGELPGARREHRVVRLLGRTDCGAQLPSNDPLRGRRPGRPGGGRTVQRGVRATTLYAGGGPGGSRRSPAWRRAWWAERWTAERGPRATTLYAAGGPGGSRRSPAWQRTWWAKRGCGMGTPSNDPIRGRRGGACRGGEVGAAALAAGGRCERRASNLYNVRAGPGRRGWLHPRRVWPHPHPSRCARRPLPRAGEVKLARTPRNDRMWIRTQYLGRARP